MIRGVLYVLQSSKDWMVRQEGLEAICCIARALLPELIQLRFQFIHTVNNWNDYIDIIKVYPSRTSRFTTRVTSAVEVDPTSG